MAGEERADPHRHRAGGRVAALRRPSGQAGFRRAAAGPRHRSLTVGGITCAVGLGAQALTDGVPGPAAFGTLGWLVAAVGLGEAVRVSRARLADLVNRRVTEERLRIARDLHDLLAHSITAIHVQAGVAAHLVGERDGRADPETAVRALARHRPRLRAGQGRTAGHPGGAALPRPGHRLPAAGARAVPAAVPGRSGTRRRDRTGLPDHRRAAPTAPGTEVAVYRIVQEAPTNVVKHASATRVTVALDYRADTLTLAVTDDGHGAATAPVPGHGFIGMMERARAAGGSLSAGPRPGGGFAVTAELPADASPVLAQEGGHR
ncbi:hypothetical protein C1I98_12020 [Spongiactinospora gelatinilytica]|uniref:histidine kinase n=1 Tax=Spongiactinospora gelatinilytica TaxID=2666298 RepID=A0A2W2GKB9_9ACTN|nr:histidine kinase [Spongiactinospora gelatinilytica]PZG49041.1 hypothetical protein C1I98_12020 [Spongiactinospora gelatinilytica]